MSDETTSAIETRPVASIAPNTGAGVALLDEAEQERGAAPRPRARARAIAADELVRQAQAILDAPLLCDPKEMSAEVARAKHRADLLMSRAKAMYREAYGDKVDIDAKVQMVAVIAFRGLAQRVNDET